MQEPKLELAASGMTASHAHLILITAMGLKGSCPILSFVGHRSVLCATANASLKLLAGFHDLHDNVSEVVMKYKIRLLIRGKTCSIAAIATIVSTTAEQQLLTWV